MTDVIDCLSKCFPSSPLLKTQSNHLWIYLEYNYVNNSQSCLIPPFMENPLLFILPLQQLTQSSMISQTVLPLLHQYLDQWLSPSMERTLHRGCFKSHHCISYPIIHCWFTCLFEIKVEYVNWKAVCN